MTWCWHRRHRRASVALFCFRAVFDQAAALEKCTKFNVCHGNWWQCVYWPWWHTDADAVSSLSSYKPNLKHCFCLLPHINTWSEWGEGAWERWLGVDVGGKGRHRWLFLLSSNFWSSRRTGKVHKIQHLTHEQVPAWPLQRGWSNAGQFLSPNSATTNYNQRNL